MEARRSWPRGVLSFDLHADGSLLYANGSAIFRLDQTGARKRLREDKLIEQVVACYRGGRSFGDRRGHFCQFPPSAPLKEEKPEPGLTVTFRGGTWNRTT
jgi:hypothetical protein